MVHLEPVPPQVRQSCMPLQCLLQRHGGRLLLPGLSPWRRLSPTLGRILFGEWLTGDVHTAPQVPQESLCVAGCGRVSYNKMAGEQLGLRGVIHLGLAPEVLWDDVSQELCQVNASRSPEQLRTAAWLSFRGIGPQGEFAWHGPP